MNRRRFLAGALAGGLAGCLEEPGAIRTPSPMIQIVDRDPLPDLPIRPSVEVSTAEATETTPPELQTAIENRADYPIEVGEERAIVFAYVSSEDRPGLTLLPSGSAYPAVKPGCWRLAEPIAIAEYYGIVQLEPGETYERTVEVWGSPDGERCLPSGEYGFGTQYAGARDTGDGVEEQEWQGTWGFTLAVR